MFLEKLINNIVRRMELRYQREEGCLHIRDLVSCRFKRELEETYPVLHKTVYYTPAVLLGEVVHWGIESLFNKRMVQRLYARRLYDLDIVGHPDIVLDNSVVELKYQRSLYGCPREHHEVQTQFEAWVAQKKLGILIYVTPEGWREYVYPAFTDNDVHYFIEAEKSPMWRPWECNYCTFGGVCPKSLAEGVRRVSAKEAKEG